MSVQTIEKHTCEECCLGNNNNRLATNSKLAKNNPKSIATK